VKGILLKNFISLGGKIAPEEPLDEEGIPPIDPTLAP